MLSTTNESDHVSFGAEKVELGIPPGKVPVLLIVIEDAERLAPKRSRPSQE